MIDLENLSRCSIRRLACFGDSNTWGYDPRSAFGGRYGADIRWTALLRRGDLEVTELGLNGREIPRGRELSGFSLPGPVPDAVAVMLGTNDLLQGASAHETAERMAAFLPVLSSTARGAPVILIAPPVLVPGTWVPSAALIEESRRLAAEYGALAGRHGAVFADARQWDVPLSFDGVHFTPEGHAAFARGLAAVVRELFSLPT